MPGNSFVLPAAVKNTALSIVRISGDTAREDKNAEPIATLTSFFTETFLSVSDYAGVEKTI